MFTVSAYRSSKLFHFHQAASSSNTPPMQSTMTPIPRLHWYSKLPLRLYLKIYYSEFNACRYFTIKAHSFVRVTYSKFKQIMYTNSFFSYVPNSSRRRRVLSTLTQEIMRDILKRLPVKSLTRFRSVSKEWFKLFITPKFISDHLLSPTQNNRLLILDRFYWKNNIYGQDLFLLEVKRKELKELHVPRVTDSDMGFKMVGSCNGLVCVSHYSLDPTSTLFLWNPATRQTKRILEPQNALLPYKVAPNCLIGFYFNSNDKDYEVVRLHSFEDRDSACWGDSLGKIRAVRVEKYSLRNGSWREIECCDFQGVFAGSDRRVTVNGALFWTENSVTVKGALLWVAMEVSERANYEMIISFNSCNNVLRKIEMPGSVMDCPEVYKKLAVYKDSVAVIICSETRSMEQWLDLWILDDKYEGVECWTKLHTIGFFSKLERPVGIWKNEVFMATGEVIHSLSGIKALLPAHDLGAEFSYNIFNYAESLVPLYS